MTWNTDEAPSQAGKTVVITGANTGLGYEVASAFAKLGAKTVLASRNMQRLVAAQERIMAVYPDADLACLEIDLESLASVRSFVETFNERFDRLDLLINNAGIMMTPYRETTDGFEAQLATNYIGHFLLTKQLIPALRKAQGARVISVTSFLHRWGKIRLDDLHLTSRYNPRKAYNQSKLACLMFAYELQRRFAQSGENILSVAAHPGISDTELVRHLPGVAQFLAPYISQSAKDGSEPILYAALGNDIEGGEYCGPNGFRQYYGKPVKLSSSQASKSEKVASKLWQATEHMIGSPFDLAMI